MMRTTVHGLLARNYAEYYGHCAELSEWRRLGAIDKCSNIVRLCSQFEHEDILEIGCGDGAILERLAEQGFGAHFVGLDISPSAVKAAQEKYIPRADVQLFDGYEVPFPERRFDQAILTHVLEHVEYPRKLIYEAGRAAKFVCVEVPLEHNWRLSPDFVFDRVGHINFYSVKTIRRLVQSCGMNILNTHLSHSSRALYTYRKGLLRGSLSYLVKGMALKLAPRTATGLFTYHYSLICTKASS